MKKMIKKLAMVVAVFACLIGTSVYALSIGDANYVGSVNDGIPSSAENEVVWINTLIDQAAGSGDTVVGTETYNRVGSTLVGLPDAVVTGAVKDESGDNSIDATGYHYIIGKYDATRAGSLVWYSAVGFSGTITLPTHYNNLEISHISLYNGGGGSVPDSGMTLILLGTALAGLGAARRFLKA
jgi:hypothetical protein